MEDKTMMEILHNNCKKEQIRRIQEQERQEYIKEQQWGAKWNKRLMIALILGLIFEITILIVERIVR